MLQSPVFVSEQRYFSLIAPRLHQKSALWVDRKQAAPATGDQRPRTDEIMMYDRISYFGHPSSVFRRSQSDHTINWFGGSVFHQEHDILYIILLANSHVAQ